MSYRVIRYFTDLQDANYPYNTGDTFPRVGMVVSEARLKSLSSKNNKKGFPLIERVEDEKESELPFVTVGGKYTKTEINRMPIAELKKLASEKGVVGCEDMNGADLKKALIELLEL